MVGKTEAHSTCSPIMEWVGLCSRLPWQPEGPKNGQNDQFSAATEGLKTPPTPSTSPIRPPSHTPFPLVFHKAAAQASFQNLSLFA